MLFYMAFGGAFSHGQDDVEGGVLGGTDLGSGWVFSEWFGIYNGSFYPWIFHNQHGWQYVSEGEDDGELYLYDLRSEDWWFTSESIYPSFFSFGRRTWNYYFEETVNPRQFVDLESEDFWSLEIPDETEEISEREALEAFYEATGGPDWANSSNWRTNLVLGEWHGVDVDDQGRVISIDLAENNLMGEIPAELGALANLQGLLLYDNDLTGEIPAELGALANLQALFLHGNDLTGEIPVEFGSLVNLEFLLLHENNLTGEIPVELGALTNLESLWLAENDLTGEIPVEFGSLVNLEFLFLHENNLTGEIPAELGALAKLEYLYLSGNSLTGKIPAELGALANLQNLWLHENDLTGDIPVELGSPINLQGLFLHENNLTGEIPVEFGSLVNLEYLWLQENDLTGEIPAELGSLVNLQNLWLHDNNLTGEIPVELSALANLEDLDLSDNDLTGEIPGNLGKLANLEDLDLSKNSLTGEIPVELSALVNLQYLWLNHNNLTGEIPVELGKLVNLQYLWLNHNNLTGEIPVELSALANLEDLDLSENSLTGEIPGELGKLVNLQDLILANNSLTGEIPAELGGLVNLEALSVSMNSGMSGEMPARLTNLRQLEALLAHDTGLCAPSDARFRKWLAGLWKRRVIACSAGDPPSFYLTQAAQSREFPVPLILGEDALLRVFVTTPQETEENFPPVRARFFLNGAENYAVDIPGKSLAIPNEVYEGDLDASANAEIPGRVVQPGLKMVIDVDPEGTLVSTPGVRRRIPERGLWPVDVREMPLFELTVIPFQRSANPDSSILELVRAMAQDPEGHSLLWETRTLLPVRDLVVTAHPSVLTSSDHAMI